MTHYQELIKAVVPDSDPRHVQAFMLSEHDTLDGLSSAAFSASARAAAAQVAQAGPEMAEMLAASYGLFA